MTSIKIILLFMAFLFFTPMPSYAIIQQVAELPKAQKSEIGQQEKSLVILGTIFLASSIYPLLHGYTKLVAATTVLPPINYWLLFVLGAALLIVSLIAFGSYFVERYKRKRNGY